MVAASDGVLRLERQKGRDGDGSSVLTTGEMARMSGNTLRTVRFYEEEGLLSPLSRSEGGHRLFPESELHKLQFVTELRTAGLSLEEIREVLTAKQRNECGSAAAGELVEKLDAHIVSVTERLSAMQRLLSELSSAREMLRACCECRRRELFPESCGECEVMTSSRERPAAVSVLWGVRR